MSFEPPRPIRPEDDVVAFDCGEPVLNDWLARRALHSDAQGGARVYTSCWAGTSAVAAYYSLSTSAVAHADVAGRHKRNMPDPVPVILLGRRAVDHKAQGSGLGSHLLRDAIARSVQAADIIGVRAILVHALHPQAAAFYARYDFDPSPTDPLHLLLPMRDARAIAGG